MTNYEYIKSLSLSDMADYLVHFNICGQCASVNKCMTMSDDVDCASEYRGWLLRERASGRPERRKNGTKPTSELNDRETKGKNQSV